MPTPPPPPLRTTPLAHVILAPGGASLEIDGRSIRLAGEEAGPSLSAFHAFHDAALADYRNRPPPDKPPGLLSRLRSWIGHFFLPKEPSEKASKVPPSPGFGAQTEPPHPPNAKPSPSHPRDTLKSPETPHLKSVFADKDGVHLLWQPPSPRPANEVSFLCRLDSDVAHKLEACYTQLGKLGYKVVGLDALSKEAEASRPAEATHPGAGHEPHAVPRPSAAKDAAAQSKAPVLATPLEPGPAPAVAKALAAAPSAVSPAPGVKSLVVALPHEAPPEDRLTYLRGTLSRTGLKIAEVGLGEGKDGNPARWEDASRWFARHAEPEPPKPDRSPLPDLL